MRDFRLANEQNVEKTHEAFLNTSLPMTHKTYHEMAETPVLEGDSISQLHANIEMLNEMQTRLSFLMREVRYLMKI